MKEQFLEFAERVRKGVAEATNKEVKFHSVRKNNGVILHGITVISRNCNIAPTVYLEKWYKEYEEGESMRNIISGIIRLSEQNTGVEDIDMSFFRNYEEVKPYLACKVINADMNLQLLKEAPHKRYLNLAVVCFCNVSGGPFGSGSILIRNEHLDMWNVKAEEVVQESMNNTRNKNQLELLNMREVLNEINNDPEDIIVSEFPMWVLTNKKRLFGASAILYDNQLEKVAEEMQDDFYILPSSIHELIIVPKKYATDSNYFVQMVRDINQDQVNTEERLADNIYFYHRESKQLQMIF